jgi:hypothetical protein
MCDYFPESVCDPWMKNLCMYIKSTDILVVVAARDPNIDDIMVHHTSGSLRIQMFSKQATADKAEYAAWKLAQTM